MSEPQRAIAHARQGGEGLPDGAFLGTDDGDPRVVLRRNLEKAREHDHPTAGAVLASDAFFPFADGPQAAIEAGRDPKQLGMEGRASWTDAGVDKLVDHVEKGGARGPAVDVVATALRIVLGNTLDRLSRPGPRRPGSPAAGRRSRPGAPTARPRSRRRRSAARGGPCTTPATVAP